MFAEIFWDVPRKKVLSTVPIFISFGRRDGNLCRRRRNGISGDEFRKRATGLLDAIKA